MATMTVSIPDNLKRRLDKFPDTNWTEVLRREFIRRVKLLNEFGKFSE